MWVFDFWFCDNFPIVFGQSAIFAESYVALEYFVGCGYVKFGVQVLEGFAKFFASVLLNELYGGDKFATGEVFYRPKVLSLWNEQRGRGGAFSFVKFKKFFAKRFLNLT